MTFLVNCLIESASELLTGVDEYLLSLAIHFECFGKGFALSLNQTLRGQNHVVLYLMLEHINFARSLVVGL